MYRRDGRIRVHRHEGERYIDGRVQQTDDNVVPFIMVWDAFHFEGKSELVIVKGPWFIKFADGCSGKISCHVRNNFVLIQDIAPPHKQGTGHYDFCRKLGRGGHGLASQKLWYEPYWACLGPNGYPYSWCW